MKKAALRQMLIVLGLAALHFAAWVSLMSLPENDCSTRYDPIYDVLLFPVYYLPQRLLSSAVPYILNSLLWGFGLSRLLRLSQRLWRNR